MEDRRSDLALLDLMTPETDGMERLRQILLVNGVLTDRLSHWQDLPWTQAALVHVEDLATARLEASSESP